MNNIGIAEYLCPDCIKDFFAGTLFVTLEQKRLHRVCYKKWFNPFEVSDSIPEKEWNIDTWKLEDD